MIKNIEKIRKLHSIAILVVVKSKAVEVQSKVV